MFLLIDNASLVSHQGSALTSQQHRLLKEANASVPSGSCNQWPPSGIFLPLDIEPPSSHAMSGPAPTRPSPNSPAAALVATIRKPTTKGPSAAFQPAQSHQPAAISKQRRQHNRQGPWLMPPTENHPVARADDLLLLERRLCLQTARWQNSLALLSRPCRHITVCVCLSPLGGMILKQKWYCSFCMFFLLSRVLCCLLSGT